MEKVTLNVEGMTCGHCVKAVEDSVGKLSGVSSVSVELDNGTVVVEYNENKVTMDIIKKTIDDQGFDVK